MSFLINPYAFQVAPAVATREYRGTFVAAANATSTVTVSNVDIGAAATGRIVVCEVSYSTTVSSDVAIVNSTIGGNAASVAVQDMYRRSTYDIWQHAAIIAASVPAGTAAHVSWSISSSALISNPRCAAYRAIGLMSTTATDTANAGAGDTSVSVSIDVQEGGLLFASANVWAANDPGNYVWTGVTEDYDLATGTGLRITGGSLEVDADQTGRTVRVARPSGSTVIRTPLVAAAFR